MSKSARIAKRAARSVTEARRPKEDRWAWERRDVTSHPKAPTGLLAAYLNGIYSVQVFDHPTPDGPVTLFMVRRHDGMPIRSWADMQRIKDELAGPERTAVEVYPPADEVVDQANMYHLWVLPPGMRLKFGLGTIGGLPRWA